MCGIAGIISQDGWSNELQGSLESMQAALRHRGPDDQGLWLNSARTVGLAHTRLSILDLTSGGHQPMISADGQIAITFNGEIYNFRELRTELERAGVFFKTHSDTEVLLKLYEKDGATMVNRLRGMFAFCIWDERTCTGLLARDPFGIKPIYYTEHAGRLFFASELRTLQNTKSLCRDLDPSALVNYFKTGSVAEPQTLLQNVFCLEAGHMLSWQAGKLSNQRYWNIEFPGSETTARAAAETVREALLDSLRAHFVSDVPVGIFLSGGIDSTALLALAKEIGQTNPATFSIGVDDTHLDESTLAAQTARHFDTDHHELRLTAELAGQSFTQFLNCTDQPSIDGLNSYTVSAFAKQQGMKVVLSGLGGDELFGGYPSFQQVPKLAHLGKLAHQVPWLPALAGRIMERSARSSRSRRLGAFLQQAPTIQNAYRIFRGIFSPREAHILAARYTGCNVTNIEAIEKQKINDLNDLDAVSTCELSLYMRNQLLKDSDVMSMAHGLELRVPFVDRQLFEKISTIPAILRLRAGKQMLLEAVPEIPEWVAKQPKRGFVFPFETWMGASWGEAFRDVTNKMPCPNPTWYQRWSVFMMERWLERT